MKLKLPWLSSTPISQQEKMESQRTSLRTVAGAISPSITKLFNLSLLQGQIPSEWKKANITPIPKTSISKSPSNFRPISVLPVLAKVFESLIHHQIYSYLTAHSLLHPCQSGFRPSHSTQDTLLKTVDDWRIALDRGEYVGAILIDLSKAFDSIDHAVLLSKLSAYELQLLKDQRSASKSFYRLLVMFSWIIIRGFAKQCFVLELWLVCLLWRPL